jgi:hypothetical protein
VVTLDGGKILMVDTTKLPAKTDTHTVALKID